MLTLSVPTGTKPCRASASLQKLYRGLRVNGEQEKSVNKEELQDGRELLRQPVLPLVSMVQLMYQFSGPGTKVADIIAEMREPITTDSTAYAEPDTLLRRYLEQLQMLEDAEANAEVVDTSGKPVDAVTARSALIRQGIAEAELEEINSRLCAPCHCRLCCIGPEQAMEQEFFEIPLQDSETELFPLARHDRPESRETSALASAMHDNPLLIKGRPFYQGPAPELVRWRRGWSMILPKKSSCPALEKNGRCTVYTERPQVCRRPQIFGYILEPLEERGKYMLRNTLLAISDCPYVQLLQEEIAAYAAASELDCIFRANKG